MDKMAKSRLWFCSAALVVLAPACGGAGEFNGPTAEETPAEVEQKYTPAGRVLTLHQNESISALNKYGSGDADVYTQKGRTYTVNLWADKATYVPGSGRVTTTLHYLVQEQYPDWTYLYKERQVTFYVADTAYRINNVINPGTFLDRTEVCPYNDCQYTHTYNVGAAPPGQEEADPIIHSIQYKYDGNGPDDSGANTFAYFDLWVHLDVTDY